MSGNISLAPNTVPSANIGFATGGAPGNIKLAPGGAAPGTIRLATGGAPGNITVPGSTAPAPAPPGPSYSDSINSQIAALEAQIAKANAPVYAPALDTNAIYNQASTTAAANVNPYYTKLLNDFITQQGTARQQQQTQTATNVQNLQTQLAQLKAGNQVTGDRAVEDAATTEGNIATAADERQLDQGTAFDTARDTQAGQIAASGLTGSGIGAGQQLTAQNTQDTTETRQANADQTAKNATELSKARTFEDLATSNTNATTSEGQGEQQQQFNLNNFITGQSTDLQGEQQTLEQQRQQALASEKSTQTKLLINNFINSISNPAQRQAAISTYGSFA